MADLNRRLVKLEATTHPLPRRVVAWAIQGPHDMPEGAAAAFLRSCGHDVRDEDHNLIRIMVGAEDGRPIDLPLKDLTRDLGRGLSRGCTHAAFAAKPGPEAAGRGG